MAIKEPSVVAEWRFEEKVRFRLHRGSLRESMETERAYRTIEEMARDIFERYMIKETAGIYLGKSLIEIAPYCDRRDDRIGWECTSIINIGWIDEVNDETRIWRGYAFCNVRTDKKIGIYYDREKNVMLYWKEENNVGVADKEEMVRHDRVRHEK